VGRQVSHEVLAFGDADDEFTGCVIHDTALDGASIAPASSTNEASKEKLTKAALACFFWSGPPSSFSSRNAVTYCRQLFCWVDSRL
jgi:hypothetical protein